MTYVLLAAVLAAGWYWRKEIIAWVQSLGVEK